MAEKGGVQSVERIFALIELLAAHPAGASLQTLAQGTDLAKSTVHRLLASLVGLGYVSQEETSGRYRLTLKMFELSSGIVNDMAIMEVAQVWAASRPRKLTERTVADLPHLQEQLETVRAKGYAVDDEENELGVRCVAVAIPGPDGRADSAFSISGLTPYMTPERIRRIAAMALDSRTDILADLGIARRSAAQTE